MATAPSRQDSDQLDERTKPPFLRRVQIRGYKSIAFCDVQLQPMTILVGRNGSGKSNFLDALAFLRDAVRLGVPEAVRRRGGLQTIRCRSAKSDAFSISVEAGFSDRASDYIAHYGLTIPVNAPGAPDECREWLRLRDATGNGVLGFRADQGKAEWSGDGAAQLSGRSTSFPPDRLFLSVLGDLPFVELSDGLRWTEVYNFHPDAIRRVQPLNASFLLDRDGSNLAGVIDLLKENDPDLVPRVREYLAAITPEVLDFDTVRYGEYETVRFRMRSGSADGGLDLDARSVSDGTLRALAAIMAAFQIVLPYGHPSVIGIEEPETSLHPAATHALVDALQEATGHTQVLLTTHSGDLLSDRDLDPSQILVVRNRDGQTQIAPMDAASREIVRKELYTVADLQRMDQLDLDESDLARQAASRSGNGEE